MKGVTAVRPTSTDVRRAARAAVAMAIALVVLVPASAFATVQPFAMNMPGGGGTGGGMGEIWPIGFGFVTGQSGPLWGDGLGDTYQALTRDTTYISGTDPLGGPQRLLAFVNKNPRTNKAYIKLKKNGVEVADFDTYIQNPNRNSAIIVPDFLSLYPILYPGAIQNNAWFIPINGLTLDPGCAYELRFLRGITANNGLSCVIYTDAAGNDLGYIQRTGWFTYPDEDAQYNAKQWDTFLFRNENVPSLGYTVTDESKRYEDFLFRFQTYADLTAFEAALTDAEAALATVETGRIGFLPNEFNATSVADLESVVASASAVSTDDMRKRLQTDVDAATAALDAAAAAAPVPNAVPGQPDGRPVGGRPDVPPGRPEDRPPVFAGQGLQ